MSAALKKEFQEIVQSDDGERLETFIKKNFKSKALTNSFSKEKCAKFIGESCKHVEHKCFDILIKRKDVQELINYGNSSPLEIAIGGCNYYTVNEIFNKCEFQAHEEGCFFEIAKSLDDKELMLSLLIYILGKRNIPESVQIENKDLCEIHINSLKNKIIEFNKHRGCPQQDIDGNILLMDYESQYDSEDSKGNEDEYKTSMSKTHSHDKIQEILDNQLHMKEEISEIKEEISIIKEMMKMILNQFGFQQTLDGKPLDADESVKANSIEILPVKNQKAYCSCCKQYFSDVKKDPITHQNLCAVCFAKNYHKFPDSS